MNRVCGDCQLCCLLMPVEEMGKKASVRCKYQRAGKGCSIYPRRDHRSWAWRASYHRNEIKRCQKEIERHTARLNVASLKARDERATKKATP